MPEARGQAARIKAQAEGYRAERIAIAQGEGERFNLLVTQYKAAPEVTRKRLYIETMQKVLGESSKVIDLSAGKNLLYLPLEAGKTLPSQTVEAIAPAISGAPEPQKGGR